MQLHLLFTSPLKWIFYTSFISGILLYPRLGITESGKEVCSDSQIINRYYLINVADIYQVSGYFNTLSSNIVFRKLSPALDIKKGIQKQYFRYFDYPDKQLLKNNQELFLVINQSLPPYREDREVISFYDNRFQLDTHTLFKVKNYKRKKNALDKHELLSKIRRKDRAQLKKLIYYEKIDAVDLIPVIDVDKEEVVLLISHYGTVILKITLGKFHIANYGLANTFSVLKFEFNEKKLSFLNKEETEQVKTILCTIHNNFKDQFPHIKESPRFGYQFYDKVAHQLLPTRDLFDKYPLFYKIGQACFLALIGFLVLYLLIRRYSKVSNYKIINKTGNNNVL